MIPSPQPGLDMRAFRWSLAPLERKLQWERDASQSRMALVLQRLRDCEQRNRHLASERDSQVSSAAARWRQAADPQAHRQALRFLARMETQLAEGDRHWRALQMEVDRARQDCLERERRLETLMKMRRAAIQAHVRVATLRLAKEADIAWLARDPGPRSGDGDFP